MGETLWLLLKAAKMSVLHGDGGAIYKKVPFGVIFGPAADAFKCKWQRRF